MLHISACVTPNSVPHPSQWIWRFKGENLQQAHKKSQNYVADSTVPETVVPRTLIEAPVLLARRSRCLSLTWRLITKPLILDSYATSRDFFLSRHSSIRVQRWSELENFPPPVTVFPELTSLDSGFPVLIFWSALQLELYTAYKCVRHSKLCATSITVDLEI